MLETARGGRSEVETMEFETHLGVERTERSCRLAQGTPRHVLSVSIFWKHVGADDPELPTPTRESLIDAKRMGLVKRFSPWESYV